MKTAILNHNRPAKGTVPGIENTKLVLYLVGVVTGRDYQALLGEHLRLYLSFMHHKEHRGRESALAFYKKLYHVSTLIALEQPFDPLPWTKADKAGVPKLIKPFYEYLTGDKWDKRVALTLIRVYTLQKSTPKPDLTTITNPLPGAYPEALHKEFEEFVSLRLKPLELPEANPLWVYGARKGPNGPAVASAHLDAKALQNEGLLDKWREVADEIRHPLRMSLNHCLQYTYPTEGQVSSGKLAFLPEKGGKTRIIAIVDFWSQQLLRPFHESLMSILRDLGPQDSTFDQDSAFKRVLKETSGKSVNSIDLKSATDRFPSTLQRAVLRCIWPKLGDTLMDIMVNRSFRVKDSPPIRWAVGQPLGSYMSWPLFTLTHHLFVQFAASKVYKKETFNEYQLLGDDIVIWNDIVAREYLCMLDRFHIPIAHDKTITSAMGHSSGEFAKRIFIRGIEVSPIPLHLIAESGSKRFQMPILFELIEKRWEIDMDLSGQLAFRHATLSTKLVRKLEILLGFRRILQGINAYPWCALGEAGALFPRVSSYFIEKSAESVSLAGSGKYNKKRKDVFSIDFIKNNLKASGLVVPDSLLDHNYEEDFEPHPLVLLYRKYIKIKVDTANPKDFGWNMIASYESKPSNKATADTIKQNRIPLVESMKMYFALNKDSAVPTIVLEFYFKEAARILAEREAKLLVDSSEMPSSQSSS
jgi:hypothetical protein